MEGNGLGGANWGRRNRTPSPDLTDNARKLLTFRNL